jgi:lipoprotein-anchoring transpeptidase ErfK/SrfK
MLHDLRQSSIRMKLSRLLFAVVSAGLAIGLSACAVVSPTQNSFSFDPPVQRPTNPSAVKLRLSTGAQRLYVVEGNTVLLATPVTVGTRTTPTPHGNFTIYSKVANRRRHSSPGAGYPMTYWMEFKPAYGLHWGFVKPTPSTHGCVRMPIDSARKTFQLIRVGTPINIATSQPWDETIGKNLPVLDDSSLPDPPMSYMLSSRVFADASQGNLWRY